jgi:protein-disulfide isomerase
MTPETPAPEASAPAAAPPPVPPSYPSRSGGAGRGLPAVETTETSTTRATARHTDEGDQAVAAATDVPETRAGRHAAARPTRRRSQRPLLIGGIVAVVAIAGLAWALIARSGGSDLPPGVAAMGDPLTRGTAKAGVKVLDIYEDFQCPECGQFETLHGPSVRVLAESGDLLVNYHLRSGLDKDHQGDNSARAAEAAVCAASVGQFGEFHDQLFANQPPSVGAGWTDEQLSQFAKDAGITGAQHQTSQKCVDDGKFADYVASVEAGAVKAGITADPAILLDGQPFTIAGLDAASFAKAVTGK